jgi:hypothetical protein
MLFPRERRGFGWPEKRKIRENNSPRDNLTAQTIQGGSGDLPARSDSGRGVTASAHRQTGFFIGGFTPASAASLK